MSAHPWSSHSSDYQGALFNKSQASMGKLLAPCVYNHKFLAVWEWQGWIYIIIIETYKKFVKILFSVHITEKKLPKKKFENFDNFQNWNLCSWMCLQNIHISSMKDSVTIMGHGVSILRKFWIWSWFFQIDLPSIFIITFSNFKISRNLLQ